MAKKIGNLTKNDDGSFHGNIKALLFSSDIKLIPTNQTDNDKAPNYNAVAGDIDIGAGWNKISANGNEFISLSLDDPSLPNPIYAGVFESKDGGYAILWDRKPAS